MPFTKSQSSDWDAIRQLAFGWGKIVTPRAFGEAGPAIDLDFDSMEDLAVEAAAALIRGTLQEILQLQAELLGAEQPCPQCARPCPVQRQTRPIAVRGGTLQYPEPVCHGPACRRDFFPAPPEFAARCAPLLARGAG